MTLVKISLLKFAQPLIASVHFAGEQHGYNIPSVERCPQLPTWLENESYEEIRRRHDDRDLPEQMRRLLCDAYICMYTSCSLAEYR